MAFHLSSQIHNDNKNTDTIVNQNKTLSSEGGSNHNAGSDVRKLIPGQTLSGEIVAVREGEVDIALSKNVVLTAKLDKNMQVFVGQTMTFEVKSNHNSQISLRPLFENLAPNPNVLNAIEASHIPLNNKSVAMVTSLMEQGMPIDKQSLQNLYKQLAANPEADPITLTQMNRLKIPVTPENIQQFENYKNYEHSIKNSIETVADEVIKMIGDMLNSGGEQEAGILLQKLTGIFMGEEGSKIPQVSSNLQNTESAQSTPAIVITESAQKTDPAMLTESAQKTDPAILAESLQKTDPAILAESLQKTDPVMLAESMEGNALKQTVKDVLVQESLDMMQQLVKEKDTASQTETMREISPEAMKTTNHEEQKAADDVIKKVTELLERYAQGQDIKDMAVKIGQNLLGRLTPEETLQLVDQLLAKGVLGDKEIIGQLLGSQEMSKLLKNQITKQWMLEPQQVGQERKVEELYERVQKQTAKLSQAILEMAKDNTPLAKSVLSLSKSVDFMNQLNQAFTYVQLPLKMSRENAHGDLYVYTNKKNLAQEDGKVSALLHLDMEYLGTMDIYVAMQDNKINTKFYLEKEEYLDFIEKHLPMLNERLEKRGYSMNSQVQLSEKKVNVVEEMLEQDKNMGLMSKYSFDVRA